MDRTNDEVEFDPGSFRDPRGQVVILNERILRAVYARGRDDYVALRDSGALSSLVGAGQFIGTRELELASAGLPTITGACCLLEHDRLPFISYPYEWTFAGLRSAAVHHLDVHLALLDYDLNLIDASAYNIQFQGTRPVFIDVLSASRYREGDLWLGHRQFCEQFLLPLLLQEVFGITFNPWYRGAQEGIDLVQFADALPWYRRMSPRMALHVVAQAILQKAATRRGLKAGSGQTTKKAQLSRQSLKWMLNNLRSWIERLSGPAGSASSWVDYASTQTYDDAEARAKRSFVAEFVAATCPRQLLDLGCNDGAYSELALQSGAQSVVGVEADAATAERAWQRGEHARLNFLPLIMDAADPSPARGWRGRERPSFAERGRFDAVIALAFEHHLAIARNVPLDQLLEWLTGLAPCGVVEFVHKNDPTIQHMLARREDIFDDYTEDNFTAILNRLARIERQETVSATGRTLYWYVRT